MLRKYITYSLAALLLTSAVVGGFYIYQFTKKYSVDFSVFPKNATVTLNGEAIDRHTSLRTGSYNVSITAPHYLTKNISLTVGKKPIKRAIALIPDTPSQYDEYKNSFAQQTLIAYDKQNGGLYSKSPINIGTDTPLAIKTCPSVRYSTTALCYSYDEQSDRKSIEKTLFDLSSLVPPQLYEVYPQTNKGYVVYQDAQITAIHVGISHFAFTELADSTLIIYTDKSKNYAIEKLHKTGIPVDDFAIVVRPTSYVTGGYDYNG